MAIAPLQAQDLKTGEELSDWLTTKAVLAATGMLTPAPAATAAVVVVVLRSGVPKVLSVYCCTSTWTCEQSVPVPS